MARVREGGPECDERPWQLPEQRSPRRPSWWAPCAPASTATAASHSPAASTKNAFGGFKHLVVIYEENHSFDNLYGSWGKVGGQQVNGRSKADAGAHRRRSPRTARRTPASRRTTSTSRRPAGRRPAAPDTVTFGDGTSTTYTSHFTNTPFNIDDYIPATDTTCPTRDALFSFPNGILNGQGDPGGCTRDLVHQLLPGAVPAQRRPAEPLRHRQRRGRPDDGLLRHDASCRSTRYLHGKGAPNYVIADHFFQARVRRLVPQPPVPHRGGSRRCGPAPRRPSTRVLDDARACRATTTRSTRRRYPAKDNALTQACGLPTTVAGSRAVTGASIRRCRRYQPTAPLRGRRSRRSTTPPRR